MCGFVCYCGTRIWAALSFVKYLVILGFSAAFFPTLGGSLLQLKGTNFLVF